MQRLNIHSRGFGRPCCNVLNAINTVLAQVLSQPKRRQAYDIVRGTGGQAAEGPQRRWGTRHEEPFDEDFREFWEKFGHRCAIASIALVKTLLENGTDN